MTDTLVQGERVVQLRRISQPSQVRTKSLIRAWAFNRRGKTAAHRFWAGSALHVRRERRIRVLLVEDDDSIAEMYRALLEIEGYAVTIAKTGRSGLEALATGGVDIVLLDILLPDGNGFDVMAEVARQADHPPVVILTNYGEPEMVERGISLGAIDYLVKSRVDPSTVSESIPGWIERSERGRGSEPDD